MLRLSLLFTFLCTLAICEDKTQYHGWLMEIPLCDKSSEDYFSDGLEIKRGEDVQEFPPVEKDKNGRPVFKPGQVFEPKIIKTYKFSGEPFQNADFGGGNELTSLHKIPLQCGRYNQLGESFTRPSEKHYYSFAPLDADEESETKILTMKGYVSNVEVSKVRAEITATLPFAARYHMYDFPRPNQYETVTRQKGDKDLFSNAKSKELIAKQEWWADNALKVKMLDLVLENSENGKKWKEVARESFTLRNFLNGMTTLVLERNIDPNKIVRFRVFTRFHEFPIHENDKKEPIYLNLHDAKLFGAQCYPDFANPEGCLGNKKK